MGHRRRVVEALRVQPPPGRTPRAGVCTSCELRDDCPIEDWPAGPEFDPVDRVELLRRDPSPGATAGPSEVVGGGEPDAVWVTAESLGDRDPALSAHPGLPVVFVFDEPLLASLRLSSKRLVFLTETLAELAVDHHLEISLGDPVDVLQGRALAVTFAPVPGFRRRVERLRVAEMHPWPWLRRPASGPIGSFSAWRRGSTADGVDDHRRAAVRRPDRATLSRAPARRGALRELAADRR